MRITYRQGLYTSETDIQIALLQCHIPHVDVLIFFGKYVYHICLHNYNFLSLYMYDSTNLHDSDFTFLLLEL